MKRLLLHLVICASAFYFLLAFAELVTFYVLIQIPYFQKISDQRELLYSIGITSFFCFIIGRFFGFKTKDGVLYHFRDLALFIGTLVIIARVWRCSF